MIWNCPHCSGRFRADADITVKCPHCGSTAHTGHDREKPIEENDLFWKLEARIILEEFGIEKMSEWLRKWC